MAKTNRVVVIEENRQASEALAALLDAQPDFRVVAAAGALHAVPRRLQETKPHVVLVDASLGNRSSHGFVESVRKTTPEASGHRDGFAAGKGRRCGIRQSRGARRATIDDLLGTVDRWRATQWLSHPP
jgi:hypothetical protein